MKLKTLLPLQNEVTRLFKTKLEYLDDKLWDTLVAYIKELIKKGELATWEDYYAIRNRLIKLTHDTIDAQVGNHINEGFFSSKEEKLHKALKAYVQELDKQGELKFASDIKRAKSKLKYDYIETIMGSQFNGNLPKMDSDELAAKFDAVMSKVPPSFYDKKLNENMKPSKEILRMKKLAGIK